ncbi:MAG: hypothetical protein JWO31_1610, partial [Phycisphaerales bacterium]|nr:hypothetical protein [Phycisphaerales bacterium]
AVVAAMGVALPIAGMVPKVLRRVGGGAWYPPAAGGAALAAAVVVSAGMFALARRGRPGAALAASAVVVLGTNALLLWAYADAPAGRSEMRPIAERILAADPVATVAYADPGNKPMPPDLSIYLNRMVRPLDAVRRRGMPDPDVVVALQREGHPPPSVPGYRSFAAEPYGKRFWHALGRER